MHRGQALQPALSSLAFDTAAARPAVPARTEVRVQIIATHFTVSDFCEQLNTGSITVNRRYQRSDKVWPETAQSFLIETLLRGFPVPKLFLHQKTDRVSKKSVRDIIDGQQRATAIKTFFDGELRLAKDLELVDARDRTYEELDPDLQSLFLNYPLGVDLFTNATEDDVREVFRRINSYEVPLNPEEQRHARYQGEFKWFIYHLSSQFDVVFFAAGAFSEKQLVRMQDMKLLTEVAHALMRGITTTNKTTLNNLYKEYDRSFPEGPDLSARISAALGFLSTLELIHGTALVKPYSLYALLLAHIHVNQSVPWLESVIGGGQGLARSSDYERRLAALAEAMEVRDEVGPLAPFVRATTSRTNVRDQRETRFRYCVDAMSAQGGELIPV